MQASVFNRTAPPPRLPGERVVLATRTARKRRVFDGPLAVAAAAQSEQDVAEQSDDGEDGVWWCDVAQPGCLKPNGEAPEPSMPYVVWRCQHYCSEACSNECMEWIMCSMCHARGEYEHAHELVQELCD